MNLVDLLKKNIVMIPVVASVIVGTFTGVRYIVSLTETINKNKAEIAIINDTHLLNFKTYIGQLNTNHIFHWHTYRSIFTYLHLGGPPKKARSTNIIINATVK